MELKIVTPDGEKCSAQVDSVNLPGELGELGILPGHTALMSTLVVGKLRYTGADGEVVMAVNRGFVEVLDDVVTVLTETCEKGDEVDEDRAKEALDRARKRLHEAHASTNVDVARAEYALQRALSRLRAAGKGSAE